MTYKYEYRKDREKIFDPNRRLTFILNYTLFANIKI